MESSEVLKVGDGGIDDSQNSLPSEPNDEILDVSYTALDLLEDVESVTQESRSSRDIGM